jgi:hypothetical protein
MMKRNYIIIISFVISVAVIFGIFLKFFTVQKKESENQETISSSVDIPQDNAIQLPDINNPSQIKESYKKYVSQNVDDFPLYKEDGISIAYSMDDQNGKLVPLDSFLQSVGATINPKIKNLIRTNYYGFFYCPNEKSRKDFGVTLELGGGDSKKLEDVNLEAKEAMRQWEPYILKDLRNILFPENNFSEDQLSQPLVFKEGEFRYTEVSLPGGEKSSINYTVDTYPPDHPSSTNSVYITTSKDCLQKSLGSLFDF